MTYTQISQGSARIRRNQALSQYRDRERRVSLGPFSNALVLIIATALMGLLYLTQITKTSVYGFEVNELKQEKTTLETENQNLRIEAARLQSVERLRSSEQAKALSDVEQVRFVDQPSQPL